MLRFLANHWDAIAVALVLGAFLSMAHDENDRLISEIVELEQKLK